MKLWRLKKMNRLILKQKKKEEEKKKKDKKKQKQEPETIRITKELIKARLVNHFKNHIGEEERTSQEEIFQAITGVNTYSVNSFARWYFWDSINKVIRELRRKNLIFIIRKQGHFFVLKSQDEADYFRKVCDKAIEGMENAKTRADDWVEQEKWKGVKKLKYDENREEEPEPQEPKSTDEIIDDKVDKADKSKTRVLRLWKK